MSDVGVLLATLMEFAPSDLILIYQARWKFSTPPHGFDRKHKNLFGKAAVLFCGFFLTHLSSDMC